MRHKKLPSIKKNIKAFLNSEEGKLTKKNALKLGMTLGILGTMFGHTVGAHTSCWKQHSSCHSSHDSCHSSHSSGCPSHCPSDNVCAHDCNAHEYSVKTDCGTDNAPYYNTDGCSGDKSAVETTVQVSVERTVLTGYDGRDVNNTAYIH